MNRSNKIMLFYFPTVNKYLTKVGLLSDEFLDYALVLEKEWQQSQKHLSPTQLIEIFPKAKPILKRTLIKEIKQFKQDLTEGEKIRIEFNNKYLNRARPEDKWFYSLVRDILFVNPLTEGRGKKIKRNYFYLSSLKPIAKELKINKITDADIEKAKDIPIEFLYFGQLQKRGNLLVGFCPFHNDRRTPNFTIYVNQNRFHCFSCLVSGDSIDFIQKLNNCDFIKAIKTLLIK